MNILFKGKDGSVAIMTLAPEADKEDAIKKFLGAHEGMYVDHFEYNGAFPESREFRDAWKLSTKNEIVVDKNKASALQLGRIRHVRNLELEKLDKEQLRHLHDAEKLAEIEAKKQILRDLPAKIKDLEWPAELPR